MLKLEILSFGYVSLILGSLKGREKNKFDKMNGQEKKGKS